jgi:4-amino-4-deoxy-L-arabinose transferase-like glycosyltransferase
MSACRLSVIVPVFNGASFIAATVRELSAYLDGRAGELIVVDDGSTDATVAQVRAASAAAARPIRLLHSAQNRGKGAAIADGVRVATGEHIVFLDADLAYPPSELTAISAALAGGVEVAIASRVHPESRYVIRPSFFRYLYTRHVAGRLFNWLVRLVLLPGLSDTQAGLKGFSAAAARRLFSAPLPHGFSFDLGLLLRARQLGLVVREIPVCYRYESEPSTVRFALDTLAVMRDMAVLRARSLGRMPARARRAWVRPLLDADAAPAVLVATAAVAYVVLACTRLAAGGGTPAVASWLVGLLALAGLAWRGDRDGPPWRCVRTGGEAILFGAVLTLGAALRFVRLAEWPPMIHIDTAECGLRGLALLRGAVADPFDFSPWYSTPYLGFVPYALSFAAGGISLLTLRLPSAVFGTLSLVPLYVLARTWFGVRTALLSTALLAVSHAAIHFSRIGLWNIQTLFCTLTAFALLAVGLRRNRALAFYGAGLVSGLALYSYTAGRLIPLVVLVFLAVQCLGQRRRRTLRLAGYYLLGFAAAVTPLVLNYVKDPSVLTSDRTASVWVLADDNRAHVEATTGVRTAPAILATQTARSLGGFVGRGDTSSQYGTEQPLLSPWMALLGAVGLIVALRSIAAPRYRFLVLWAGLGLVLGSILVIDPPSYTRLVVIFPVPYILAAVGLAALLRGVRRRLPLHGSMSAVACVVVVALAAAFNLAGYGRFIEFMRQMPREWDVLQVMARAGGSRDYYLFTGPFLLGDSSVFQLFAADARTVSCFSEEDLPERLSRDAVFIVQGEFRGLGMAISERFPGATREVIEDEGRRQMVVYQCSRDNACRTAVN